MTDCSWCGSTANNIFSNHPGYRADLTFDIFECASCNTTFAWPLVVPSGIYEAIYGQASSIEGYNRYVRYAKEICNVSQPLDWLSESEDAYWAISTVLKPESAGAKVLEIGSGLGYLKYAVNVAGYDVTGVDISKEAVAKATQRFGNLYHASSIEEYAHENPNQFDLVIATELIEHVPKFS